MCKHCNHTIHAHQHHFGWDNSFAPALTAAPGEAILFQCLDSSGGQLGPQSTVEDVQALDFAKINPVSGPIYVDGAKPGDVLKVTIESFTPQLRDGAGFGWTANIPGFGLLADEVPDPQGLGLWTTVNGERRQSGHTRDMVFPVRQLVAYVSRFMSLRVGDLISTGTPAGVGQIAVTLV